MKIKAPHPYPPLKERYEDLSARMARDLKKRWLAETGKTERTFDNRLLEPHIEDYVLFSKVLGIELETLLGRDVFPPVEVGESIDVDAFAKSMGLQKPD